MFTTPDKVGSISKSALERVKARAWTRGQASAPICPYGCGRPGTLLEVVMKPDGQAIGIYNDYPCDCIFQADIQLTPDDDRKVKLTKTLGGDVTTS